MSNHLHEQAESDPRAAVERWANEQQLPPQIARALERVLRQAEAVAGVDAVRADYDKRVGRLMVEIAAQRERAARAEAACAEANTAIARLVDERDELRARLPPAPEPAS